jgi:60 kDa SS-A/Ro ribonucleoprotein
MAAILKRIEGGNVHVIDVDTQVHPSRITTRPRVREIGFWRPSGGGTDLSLPFTHATKHKMEVDGFALFTDGETWASTTRAPGWSWPLWSRSGTRSPSPRTPGC